ncbi:uncharacterized protein LOC125674476 isoform X2 [Ostrea edulis]|uniref:uncharacterized protein LOC125674476 isoform X2 n=1 Tax=Ostrea edulis TaxID=37623 RepID=UPI00209522D7|nr:uncharacterized protein LOC125674476 isoform X2 [Ostrea edulis]
MLAQRIRMQAASGIKMLTACTSSNLILKNPNLRIHSRSTGNNKQLYWNGNGVRGDKSVYCMQFDASGLKENELSNFATTLQNDVTSMKPDIVYIQQTKESVYTEEIGLRMKRMGYDGYVQNVAPELKQATFFRSNLLSGSNGDSGIVKRARTG